MSLPGEIAMGKHGPCQQMHPDVEFGHTKALQAIPERHIEICGQAAHNRLAVRADAARQHSHLSSVKEFDRLPYERPKELRPAQQRWH